MCLFYFPTLSLSYCSSYLAKQPLILLEDQPELRACSACPLKIAGVAIANCVLDFVNCFAITNCNEVEKIKMCRLIYWSASDMELFMATFTVPTVGMTLEALQLLFTKSSFESWQCMLIAHPKGAVAAYFCNSFMIPLRTSLTLQRQLKYFPERSLAINATHA